MQCLLTAALAPDDCLLRQDTLLVSDLGTDEVRCYAFSCASPALVPSPAVTSLVGVASVASLDGQVGKIGAGPRHVALHPAGRLAFVVLEMASKVS